MNLIFYISVGPTIQKTSDDVKKCTTYGIHLKHEFLNCITLSYIYIYKTKKKHFKFNLLTQQ